MASVADLTFLPALSRVIRRNVKSRATLPLIYWLVSLWFRRSYECVLQRYTNVGTGTLVCVVTTPGTKHDLRSERAFRPRCPARTPPARRSFRNNARRGDDRRYERGWSRR